MSILLMLQEGSGGSASTTAAKLKYSICRNLASIFKDQGDLSVAIDTYLKVINTPHVVDKQQYCYLIGYTH